MAQQMALASVEAQKPSQGEPHYGIYFGATVVLILLGLLLLSRHMQQPHTTQEDTKSAKTEPDTPVDHLAYAQNLINSGRTSADMQAAFEHLQAIPQSAPEYGRVKALERKLSARQAQVRREEKREEAARAREEAVRAREKAKLGVAAMSDDVLAKKKVILTSDFYCGASEASAARGILALASHDYGAVQGLIDRGELKHAAKGTSGFYLVTGLSGELGVISVTSGYNIDLECWFPKRLLRLEQQ